MTTPTPIATFEDMLAAMEQNPQLLAAMRAHVLGQELLSLPGRFVELQEQVNRLQETVGRLVADMAEVKSDVAELKGDVAELKTNVGILTERVDTLSGTVSHMSGTVSRLAGEDYETHVCNYAERILRRQLNINASVFSTQRDKGPLSKILTAAEQRACLTSEEVDNLDEADLILQSHQPPGYVVVEISITIQQHDVDRAMNRAALLSRATGQHVTAAVAGASRETQLAMGKVKTITIPERPNPGPSHIATA